MKTYLVRGIPIVGLLMIIALSAAQFGFSHAATVANMNCTLIVPNNPLSAKGLATPYILKATHPENGLCSETNPVQGAFVQGAILDLQTGAISLYNPLVITQGTTPAVAPQTPTLPHKSIVALWFGFNGAVLRLQGKNDDTLEQANCVNGLGKSLFGQVSYCNAPHFFAAANQIVRAPALGMALDNLPCPTTRDFSVVDQDQSDNVTTMYLSNANGQTAQDTAVNVTALGTAGLLANGSDNLLLTKIDAALGCTPFMAPDLANAETLAPSQPLNELQAAQQQAAPVALVPALDPMVQVNGHANFVKRALYREGVDQNPFMDANTTTYCQNMLIGAKRIALDRAFTIVAPSLDPAMATNLYAFLAVRFNASLVNLHCGVTPAFTVVNNAQGIAIDATLV